MFSNLLENSDIQNPFSIRGDLSRRIISKYHKMLILKGGKIEYSPYLSFINCRNVSWIDGKDLFEVIEDTLRDISFDCIFTKFGVFNDIDGYNIVHIKVELPQNIKEIRQLIFKRIKYVGSDTDSDKTNTPHIVIAKFKDNTPTLPSFDPQTVNISKLKFIFDGNVKIDQYF